MPKRGKRHDGTEEKAADKERAVTSTPPSPQRGEETDHCEGGLHHCSPSVARRELTQSEGGAAGKAGRVLNRANLDGRACE